MGVFLACYLLFISTVMGIAAETRLFFGLLGSWTNTVFGRLKTQPVNTMKHD